MTEIKTLKEANDLVSYVIEDKKSVPYLYADLKTFDPSNPNVRVFCDDNDDRINGIYLLYFDCLHFYTQVVDSYPLERVLQMIRELDPRIVMLQDHIGQSIKDELSDEYLIERNYIIDMDQVNMDQKAGYKSVLAARDQLVEIADLLLSEEEYSIVYDREILIKQMQDRFDSGISRYYIVVEDGKVVSSCSTYGETDDLALIGGVIVHKDYRRRGLAADVENHACADMQTEGLSHVGFVNYLNAPSLALHTKLGAVVHASYTKFIHKQ